jgi:hypothetical protein
VSATTCSGEEEADFLELLEAGIGELRQIDDRGAMIFFDLHYGKPRSFIGQDDRQGLDEPIAEIVVARAIIAGIILGFADVDDRIP